MYTTIITSVLDGCHVGLLARMSAEAKADVQGGVRQLSVAEIQAHPEYPHVTWDLTPIRKAKIDVAAGRGGPFKLCYEVHGHGPQKVRSHP